MLAATPIVFLTDAQNKAPTVSATPVKQGTATTTATVNVTNGGKPVVGQTLDVDPNGCTNPPGVQVGPSVTVAPVTDANGNATFTINTAGLPAGTYTYAYQTGDGVSDGFITVVVK